MKILSKIKGVLAQPSLLLLFVLNKTAQLYSDKLYLSLMYRIKMGYWIDWENPKTFTEKLQWLKIYNRNPEYTKMVDKYAVKEYVANLIGDDYIIPTLGVWDRPEDIDWDVLPNKFVLKTTHGGGGSGVVICRNKDGFDKKRAIAKLRKSYDICIYQKLKEWPYKNVPKRVIAEAFIEESTSVNKSVELSDYKFYCFNGEPKIMMISKGRFSDSLCFDYYDMEWNKLPLVWDKPNSEVNHPCPVCFKEMQYLCKKLTKGIPHVRCDFYIINNKPLFGELTFFDSSGFSYFEDEKWNYKLGNMIFLDFSNN